MNVNIYFLLLLYFAIESAANAQPRIGIIGGANISSVLPLHQDVNSFLYSSRPVDLQLTYNYFKPVIQWFGGLVVNSKLNKSLSLSNGASYVAKGFNNHIHYSDAAIDTSIIYKHTDDNFSYRINYLEITTNIIYGTPVGSGKAFIGAGPAFSFGLNGFKNRKGYSQKTNGITRTVVTTENRSEQKLSYGGGTDSSLKKFTFGMDIVVGYEFSNRIFLQLAYNAGLTGVFSTGAKQNLSVFQFGTGYFFGGTKNKKK